LLSVAVATPASSIAKELLSLKLFYSTSSAGGFFSPLAHKNDENLCFHRGFRLVRETGLEPAFYEKSR